MRTFRVASLRVLIDSSSDSRTETSSSTTKTMDVTSGIDEPESTGLRSPN